VEHKPTGAGKSSFGLIDPDKLFSALDLREDAILLDAACGRGPYALAAAKLIGPAGRVYAFDLWAEGIEELQKEVDRRPAGSAASLVARVADLSREIPLEEATVDVCLLATVLHDLIQDGTDAGALRETARVLKPSGKLAVVEFKKIKGPPGPPIHIRLSPEELDERLRPHGFQIQQTLDLGPFNFLTLWNRWR
jgi:ubiquinone/menaquinone biosynthesis C-methylase UbiE